MKLDLLRGKLHVFMGAQGAGCREFFRAFEHGGYAPHGLLYNNVAICLLRDRRDAEAKEVWRMATSAEALAPVPEGRARKIRRNYADVLEWDRSAGRPFRGTLVW